MLNLNSKILEGIVCDSLDKHLETNGLMHLIKPMGPHGNMEKGYGRRI